MGSFKKNKKIKEKMRTTIIISILITVILIFSLNSAAIIIKGTTYDIGLDLLENSFVEINTKPQQKIVAKQGTYIFEVPKGNYTITAKNKALSTSEQITISNDQGEYMLDLILLPELDQDFLEEIDQTEVQNYEEYLIEEKKDHKLMISIIFAGAILIIIISYLAIRKKQKAEIKKAKKTKIKELMQDDKEKVINFLKKQGGRALQKDIRREMAVSEAKISLLIDELVMKKIVEKIKKGRGNIIILK